MNRLFLNLFVSALLFITSCSGGGGGSSAPATSPCVIPINLVAITAANAENVVSEVVSAIQVALSFANFNALFIEFLNVALVNNPVTVACDISGTATLMVTDADMSGTISVGDSISFSFSNCVLMGGTANGNITATITNTMGANVGNAASATDWSFSISGMLNNFRASDGNISATINGDGTVDVNFTAATVSLDSILTSTSFTFEGSSTQCATVTDTTLNSMADNVTTNPAVYSVTVNPMAPLLTMANSEIGGVVTVQTQTAFGGMEDFDDDNDGEIDEYFSELDLPDSGVLIVNGDALSSATVTIMAGGMVQIDVDENGDMIVDQVINTTWNNL